LKVIEEIKATKTSTLDIQNWKQECYEAMNDDFNTPILIAQLFEGVRFVNLLMDNSATLNEQDLAVFKNLMSVFVYNVLGLENPKITEHNNEKLSGVLNMLIGMRNQARANKDFAMSDQIRDQLIALGIQLKDGKDGTSFSL
jgi:cysteinyl-tRNA synthetase